ncbi:MAG: hypothetical protein L3J63_07870 [Geopsychrobacter sp.]|nr:hypothetical protein [Geopsychrobacter sp.]
MLGNTSRSPLVKNLSLCVDNVPLHDLLQALTLEWGYRLTDKIEDEPLLLISEGLTAPVGIRHTLTLSSSHYQDRHRLEIPLTIETLYLALENHFHRTPRNHIRLSAEWPIKVSVRDQSFDTHSITIADRGIRFISPLELDRHEEMQIHMEQEDETYDLHAKVVYTIVGKEIGRGDQIEVGAVCTPQSKEIRDSIRSRIIGNYLKRVRPVLGSNLFAEALHQLNLTRMSKTIAISNSSD